MDWHYAGTINKLNTAIVTLLLRPLAELLNQIVLPTNFFLELRGLGGVDPAQPNFSEAPPLNLHFLAENTPCGQF